MARDIVEEMYATKKADYFSLEREIFKQAITGSALQILDIGCGTGVLGAYFREHQQCTVQGIEINEDAYQIALTNLDKAYKANIETFDLPFEPNFFDVIVMGDVLEHLISPIPALEKLLVVLKSGGHIYITVPNIRYWRVVCNLVFRDRWDYASWGILDYTHLRFFTKSSIVKHLQQSGIKVAKVERVIKHPSISSWISRFTGGLFDGFLASHTFLIIQK
jgi:2-polyprenyl-3-methyl-5-hydroxy-6-metoxy-1,4-benzoquinol methylase